MIAGFLIGGTLYCKTEDNVGWIRTTYGAGASATEGGIWEACAGKVYTGGQVNDWFVNPKENVPVIEVITRRLIRGLEKGTEVFMRKWHGTERHKAA